MFLNEMREAALVGGFFRLKFELVMSLLGTKLPILDVRGSVATGGKTDIARTGPFRSRMTRDGHRPSHVGGEFCLAPIKTTVSGYDFLLNWGRA